jgi:ABC-type amino acid transport substrate-binding protein
VIVGVVVAGWFLLRGAAFDVGGSRPDALARIRAAGMIRVAITTDPPQVAGTGGAYLGFDVDVAGALAEELGVDAIRSFDATARILDPATDPSWDVAFTDGARRGGLRETAPYYHWPVWVVVPADSPITRLEDLGPTDSLCVVRGSTGEAWMRGGAAGARAAPPRGAGTVATDDDAACLDATRSGEVVGIVTSALLESDFDSRGVRALDGPVAVDPRGALVASGADADSLAAAIDGAFGDLRGSGRLAQLSRAAFSVDLTATDP